MGRRFRKNESTYRLQALGHGLLRPQYFLIENRQKTGRPSAPAPVCASGTWTTTRAPTTSGILDTRLGTHVSGAGRRPVGDGTQHRLGDNGDPYPGSTSNRLFNNIRAGLQTRRHRRLFSVSEYQRVSCTMTDIVFGEPYVADGWFAGTARVTLLPNKRHHQSDGTYQTRPLC